MNRLSSNRRMFWRIVRRLLFAHRGRLFVILLALVAGATITAALLNLQVDAKRRLTSEFRAFGPNVIVSPTGSMIESGEQTIDEQLFFKFPKRTRASQVVRFTGFLYEVGTAAVFGDNKTAVRTIPTVLVGRTTYGSVFGESFSTDEPPHHRADHECQAGQAAAKQLGARTGSSLLLKSDKDQSLCELTAVQIYGTEEDNQVFTSLTTAQRLGRNLEGRVSLFQLIVPGTPDEIQRYINALQRQVPDLDVRPIRQFTEAQAKIYSRISGLLNFTVALVLILTALCVMAAMANVAMERRNDVGLMKAIGGARRRVVRLFLTEAALLGLIGGIVGAAAGIALSIYLGKAVFGLAARPRMIVYPVAVALTTIVAILSAYPLRHLAGVRPASVFRGEA